MQPAQGSRILIGVEILVGLSESSHTCSVRNQEALSCLHFFMMYLARGSRTLIGAEILLGALGLHTHLVFNFRNQESL